MRGKLLSCHCVSSLLRIIPAHAGQTVRQNVSQSPSPDHPRACGANPRPPVRHRPAFGSSPRMRGKPVHGFRAGGDERIIPAHAGQTSQSSWNSLNEPDHPRACGANVAVVVEQSERAGSSPRMRGKPGVEFYSRSRFRIIPAHAGQTCSYGRANSRPADHPRACGANSGLTYPIPSVAGSSPRMRGKRGRDIRVIALRRIIPAHAGQTTRCITVWTLPTDHPRACGANALPTRTMPFASGSSPRMRGKLFHNCSVVCFVRIIPAHAGQTLIPAMAFW